MKIKAILKEVILTPAFCALIVPVGLIVFLHLAWARESFWRPDGDRGEAYETWEQANGTFRVRATAYEETGVYMPDAFLAFESSPAGSDEWEEFAVFKLNDGQPIPRESLRFVKEDVAYVYRPDRYVVTVDGGRCWATWDPSDSSIDEVYVGPDGKGSAKLRRYDEHAKRFVGLEVRTEDYGRHWDERRGPAKN